MFDSWFGCVGCGWWGTVVFCGLGVSFVDRVFCNVWVFCCSGCPELGFCYIDLRASFWCRYFGFGGFWCVLGVLFVNDIFNLSCDVYCWSGGSFDGNRSRSMSVFWMFCGGGVSVFCVTCF